MESETDDYGLEEDWLGEVVMAIDVRDRFTVGCAYYVAREEKMYMMEDAKHGTVDIIESIKFYIDPTVVLVRGSIDDGVIEQLDPSASASSMSNGTNDSLGLPYVLELRPAVDFRPDAAKVKLADVCIGDGNGIQITLRVPGDTAIEEISNSDGSRQSAQARLLWLGGIVNLENSVTLGCVGAILIYLQKRRSALRVYDGDGSSQFNFQLTEFETFSLEKYMFVNLDTLMSLQILASESHPNSHNQGPSRGTSGAKESLSVYGLFSQFARTPQGKHLLRQWFLRPSYEMAVIQERLKAVSEFIRPENANPTEAIRRHLRHMKKMQPILISLRKGITTGNAKGVRNSAIVKTIWTSLLQFCFNSLKIRDLIHGLSRAEGLSAVTKFQERCDPHALQFLGRRISETIDFQESMEQGRIAVLPGVDQDLDDKKHTYAGMESLLGKVADEIAKDVPAELSAELNVIFFPQIGFLVTLRLNANREPIFQGTAENPWQRAFTTGQVAYFKNAQMEEMDAHFGDIYGSICDKEIEIVHELAQTVLEYEGLLKAMSDVCGELDCLFALAQGAKHFQLTRPEITASNVIKIEKGRHILQELTVPAFVANDTYLAASDGEDANQEDDEEMVIQSAPERPNMLLLTGPNHSGKSVYLKQVALIVYLAHVGSFVPAHSAKIGLTDKILTRLTTRESVTKSASTFVIDLQQISLALTLATNRSLLIVDEFGKGTGHADGAGLTCGLLQCLLDWGHAQPKLLAATHFHEIFERGFVHPGSNLALAHMEVQIDRQASEREDQITYLYNLREGRSTSSHGTICAALNGIDPAIIERAEQLSHVMATGQDLVATCRTLDDSETESLEAAETVARRFVAADLTFMVDAKTFLADVLGHTPPEDHVQVASEALL